MTDQYHGGAENARPERTYSVWNLRNSKMQKWKLAYHIRTFCKTFVVSKLIADQTVESRIAFECSIGPRISNAGRVYRQ